MAKNRDFSKFPNAITVLDNGNVGIGTSNPLREMVLYRSSGEVHFKIANGTTGQDITDGFDLAIDSSGGAYLINRENQPMHFLTNGTERMRITSGGNIGIGTTSVTEGTQAAGSISIIPVSSVSNAPLIQFPGNGRIRPASDGDRLSIDGNALFLNSTFNGNIVMATGGGNVGIGTSSPNGNLEVYAGTPTIISGASSSASFHGLEFRQNNTIDAFIKQLPSTGELKFSVGRNSSWGGNMTFFTDTLERMRIKSDGGISVLGRFISMDGSGAASFSSPPSGLGYGIFPHSGVGLGISSVANGISLWVGGTERARVNASGLTISSQPSFAAYKSTNQEPSSDTILTYDIADVNRGGHYNTSNSRFTAPISGVYAFGVKVWYKPGTVGTIWVHLRINGSVFTEQRMSIPTATADYTSFFPKWVVGLAAGDYVEVSGYGNGSNFHSSNTARYSQFYGHLLH